MSPEIIGLIAFVVFFVLLALGLPIGVGMALVGFGGLWYLISQGAAITKMTFAPFILAGSWDLASLPLFVLMAEVVFASGLGTDLYTLGARWLGRRPGGLAMATVAGCAGFAAVSASSLATAATFARVAAPEMKKYHYSPALYSGCIAAGGSMGSLIPPSGMLIVYGIITQTSIGRLFMAGVVPGLLEAIFYMVTIYMLSVWRPGYGPPGPSFTLKEKVAAFGRCGEILALAALVLGGILVGWFTPTEAGAVGAFGAIFFSLLRRRLDWGKFKQSLANTMKTAGLIYAILIGATIFNYFLASTNLPFALADFVSGLPLPPIAIMALIMVAYFFLGCVVDAAAMIVLTVPTFLPLVISLGFNPIWFGIMVVRAAEVAVITPPVGMNVYVVNGILPDVPLQTIFKGVIPFVISDLIHITLLLLVPSIVLFLPSIMTY